MNCNVLMECFLSRECAGVFPWWFARQRLNFPASTWCRHQANPTVRLFQRYDLKNSLDLPPQVLQGEIRVVYRDPLPKMQNTQWWLESWVRGGRSKWFLFLSSSQRERVLGYPITSWLWAGVSAKIAAAQVKNSAAKIGTLSSPLGRWKSVIIGVRAYHGISWAGSLKGWSCRWQIGVSEVGCCTMI